jgi:hypothetical protein
MLSLKHIPRQYDEIHHQDCQARDHKHSRAADTAAGCSTMLLWQLGMYHWIEQAKPYH